MVTSHLMFERHTGEMGPGTQDRRLIRGTWDLGTSTWDPSLGTRDPKPIDGIWDPEPLRGSRDPSPGTLYVGHLGPK